LDDTKADSEEVDSLKEESKEIEGADPEEASEEDARRKAALQKLESASEDRSGCTSTCGIICLQLLLFWKDIRFDGIVSWSSLIIFF
jgi:hypothetical protein